MSRYKAVFVSAAFVGIARANGSLETECAAKKSQLFISFAADCRNTLLFFRKSSRLPQGHVRSNHLCCSQTGLIPPVIYSQPWVVTLHFLILSFHYHCVQLWGLSHVCVCVIHIVSAGQKHSHHPTQPASSQLTVKFWVSRARGSTRRIADDQTRQTGFPQVRRARPQFLKRLTGSPEYSCK